MAAVTGGEDAGGESTTVTVTRDGDRIRYELTVAPGAEVDNVWVVVGGGEVASATGFERTDTDGRTRLKWTGDRPATLAVVVTGDRGGASDGPASGRESVVTGEWAFTRVPFVEVQRVRNGDVSRSWPLSARTSSGAGVVGARYALTGPTEGVARSASGREVRVVAPAGVDLREDPDAAASAVIDAGWRLDVGDRSDSVLAFAVPGVRSGGEAVPAHDEFWVNADSSLSSPENVWLHEYVHTRQSFTLATDMRWFREASAEYYAARLSYDQGYVSRRAFRAHLDGSPSTATLTDPSTWERREVPHDKGARVLAVLDRKIRAETYGYQSLQDVFRRLNDHDGPVTYAEFVQTVNEVAGAPMDEWLDRHVAGDAPVVEEYRSGSGLLGAGLAGVDHRPTPVAFVVAALGLSLVAAPPLYGFLRRRERRSPTPAVSPAQ